MAMNIDHCDIWTDSSHSDLDKRLFQAEDKDDFDNLNAIDKNKHKFFSHIHQRSEEHAASPTKFHHVISCFVKSLEAQVLNSSDKHLQEPTTATAFLFHSGLGKNFTYCCQSSKKVKYFSNLPLSQILKSTQLSTEALFNAVCKQNSTLKNHATYKTLKFSLIPPCLLSSMSALTAASGEASPHSRATTAEADTTRDGVTSVTAGTTTASILTSFDSLTAPPPVSAMPLCSPTHREGEFICGWGAAFINICVTFPINKAIFRQQLHGISGRRAIKQLRKDGIAYLYRGLLPPLLQKTVSSSIMFGMYFYCQDVLHDLFPTLGMLPNHAISAMVSGTMEASLMPFERIQALMQNREFHNRFSNTPEAFRHVWGYGLKEYYRGLSLIIWRNGPSNVAFFLGREHLQSLAPQTDCQTNKILHDFVCGACLGAMISTVFFPLNVVKTHMQSQLGGPHRSAWATLQVLLTERKGRYSKLFKGVHLNYTRSFISWGIINVSFELLIKLYNGGFSRGDSL